MYVDSSLVYHLEAFSLNSLKRVREMRGLKETLYIIIRNTFLQQYFNKELVNIVIIITYILIQRLPKNLLRNGFMNLMIRKMIFTTEYFENFDL